MSLPSLYKSFFFCLILVSSFSGFSQKIKILNTETKKGIGGVFIYNINQTINVVSDTNGIADISKFSKKDTLIFTHQGYGTFTIQKINIGNVIYLKKELITLQTVEISTERTKEKALEVISKIDRIDVQTVQLNNPQTAADMLELSGGIYIQKSQMGGGSPIIRGFEANRVLLVVDGVRLNNAIYRSGHLQNAITIDNAILDHTDIIYGANSVIYGSDAIGGVVHYQTKTPQFKKENDTIANHSANAYFRYGTANQEKTAHFDFNLGFNKIAAVTSVTFSDFEDLTMGSVTNKEYPEFGVVKHYADRIANKDTMIRKDDFTKQIGTGYRQTDILQKISYKLSNKIILNLNTQYSTSSNVPRYDQLTDYSNGKLKWSEWYYGPQNRLLTSLSARVKSDNSWFTEAEFLTSFQKIDEDRITRKFNNDNRITREEDVYVYGFNADFMKVNKNKSEWFYGAEIIHNTVTSSASSESIQTAEKSIASTRYPDNGSSLSSAALYLSFKNNFTEKATYSLGARYSFSSLNSAFADTTFIQLPFKEVTLNNGALTGNAGIAYHPNEKLKIQASVSSAFRSPNVDDAGKVFAKDDYVMIPNDQLESEYAYNGELGVTRSFFKNKFKVNVVGFYTILNNAIVRDFFQLNGADSLQYEGETLKIQANTNTSEAIIYGTSVRLLAEITDEFSVKSSLNYTIGENTVNKSPLGHIPPLYGRTDLIISSDPLLVSFYVKYQAWKRIEDYSPTGEDNENKATIDGTPPWYTLNISASMKLSKSFTIQAALENMLDIHYRPFASGVSGAGRNFVFTLRADI
jgi:outer membrane receptor protein involved in Fe transport